MNTVSKLARFGWALVLLIVLAVAQNPSKLNQASGPGAAVKKSPLIPYAGNWIGTFEGKPWLLLNLNLVGEQFSGSMKRARSIDLNDSGELKHVSEEFYTDPIVEGKLNPDGLVLTFDDAETQKAFRYLMKLTGDSTAEIRMIAMEMPPGMPKPKPWKLVKMSSSDSPRQP